jgi:hypothetical protein
MQGVENLVEINWLAHSFERLEIYEESIIVFLPDACNGSTG